MAAVVASSLFAALDKDGDGKVSASELRGAALLSEDEAAAILVALDADGDGLLDCDEFLRLAREAEGAAQEDNIRCLREAFRMYAAAEGEDEEQCITPASLRRMLTRLGSLDELGLGMDDCRAMICRFDLNGDGVLSFDEFRVMMHDGLM